MPKKRDQPLEQSPELGTGNKERLLKTIDQSSRVLGYEKDLQKAANFLKKIESEITAVYGPKDQFPSEEALEVWIAFDELVKKAQEKITAPLKETEPRESSTPSKEQKPPVPELPKDTPPPKDSGFQGGSGKDEEDKEEFFEKAKQRKRKPREEKKRVSKRQRQELKQLQDEGVFSVEETTQPKEKPRKEVTEKVERRVGNAQVKEEVKKQWATIEELLDKTKRGEGLSAPEEKLFQDSTDKLWEYYKGLFNRAENEELRNYFYSQLEKLTQVRQELRKRKEALSEPPKQTERYFELNRLAGDITLDFLDDYERLKPREGQTIDERFKEVAKEVWRDIVYGAKFDKQDNPLPLEKQDMDVRTIMLLLKKAGFKQENLLAAKPVRQGSLVPGKLNIDTGGRLGAVRETQITAPVRDKDEIYDRPTIIIDNHPESRPPELASSASKAYELLEEAGLLDEVAGEEKRVLRLMVQYSIDSDNASFPESAPGKKLEDFQRSDHTLRGLAHFMSTDQIFDYFKNFKTAKTNFQEIYTEAVVGHEFTEEEIKKYGLDKPLPDVGNLTPIELRHQSNEQARERLGKKPEELLAEGTIIKTKNLETYVVDFVERKGDKLRAGHEAVQAYGYDGYISYDLRDGSFLINTLRQDIDLSKNEKLRTLAAKCGAVIVRGAMIIKPSGFETAVKFKDILEAVEMEGEYQGKIRQAIKKPIPLERGPGYKKILRRYFEEEAQKYFEEKTLESLKKQFMTVGLDGHFIDRQGRPSAKFVNVDSWENVKTRVRAEALKRAARKPKAIRPPEAPPPPPEKTEREKLVEEISQRWNEGAREELRQMGFAEEKIPEYLQSSLMQDLKQKHILEILNELEKEDNG